jgi:hypothetical protein
VSVKRYGIHTCHTSPDSLQRLTCTSYEIRGDQDDRYTPRREGTFHVQGLSKEVGLRNFRDFVGACLHPETELFPDNRSGKRNSFSTRAPSKCDSTTRDFARLSFCCDGVGYAPIKFETRCERWDRASNEWVSLTSGRYYRAYGIIDVAVSVAEYAEAEAEVEAPPRLWPIMRPSAPKPAPPATPSTGN